MKYKYKQWIQLLICSWNHEYSLTLQETRSIHDSMNIPKIEFISYIKQKFWPKSSSNAIILSFPTFSFLILSVSLLDNIIVTPDRPLEIFKCEIG